MWKLLTAEDVLPIDYLLDIHSTLFSLNNYTGLYNFKFIFNSFQHLEWQSRAQYFNPLITLQSPMKLVIQPKYSSVTDARCKETVLDDKTSPCNLFLTQFSSMSLQQYYFMGFLHVSERQSMINVQIKHCNFQVFGGNELLLLEVNFQCLWETMRGELLLSFICFCH